MYKALKMELASVLAELQRIEAGNGLDDEQHSESSRRNHLYQSHLQLRNGGYPLVDTRPFFSSMKPYILRPNSTLRQEWGVGFGLTLSKCILLSAEPRRIPFGLINRFLPLHEAV